MSINHNYNKEIIRKLIHLSSLWMPIFIWLLPYDKSIILFGALFIFIFISEQLRINCLKFRYFYNYLFSSILRDHENNDSPLYVGAFYVILAVFIALIFFSKIIAVTSIAVMLISDSASALIGRKFGKIKILSKSLEGSIAFFVSGIATVSLISYLTNQSINFWIASVFAVLVATIIELISKDIIKIDDNLSIVLTMTLVINFLTKMFM